MAMSMRSGRRQQRGGGFRIRLSSQRRLFRTIIISLVFIAVVPPIFFHFRLKRLHQIQGRKCGWMKDPPLVCAHGGDSTNAFPNTMDAYRIALHSKVDCIEIDVSRSFDGVLFALHDRQGFAADIWKQYF
nr:glycerophosphodiester phosphodiesterase gdpd4 [Quercus suber]